MRGKRVLVAPFGDTHFRNLRQVPPEERCRRSCVFGCCGARMSSKRAAAWYIGRRTWLRPPSAILKRPRFWWSDEPWPPVWSFLQQVVGVCSTRTRCCFRLRPRKLGTGSERSSFGMESWRMKASSKIGPNFCASRRREMVCETRETPHSPVVLWSSYLWNALRIMASAGSPKRADALHWSPPK